MEGARNTLLSTPPRIPLATNYLYRSGARDGRVEGVRLDNYREAIVERCREEATARRVSGVAANNPVGRAIFSTPLNAHQRYKLSAYVRFREYMCCRALVSDSTQNLAAAKLFPSRRQLESKRAARIRPNLT